MSRREDWSRKIRSRASWDSSQLTLERSGERVGVRVGVRRVVGRGGGNFLSPANYAHR